MAKVSCEGSTTATGIGSRESAYKGLLFDICHAGVVLAKIEVIPQGMTKTLIKYTVEGTAAEIELFRLRVNGR